MQVCPPVRKLPVWDLQLSTVWVVLRVRRETKVMNADARVKMEPSEQKTVGSCKSQPRDRVAPRELVGVFQVWEPIYILVIVTVT